MSRADFSSLSSLRAMVGAQLVLGLHLQRIGRREEFGVGFAAVILAAVRADIIGGDDEALAAVDMRFDALVQQGGRERPQQQIVGTGRDRAVDQARALLPGGDDDDDEGIVPCSALPHLLDGGAEFIGGALRFTQRYVRRVLLDGLDKGFKGRNRLGAAEAERVQGGARRGAVCHHRIVNQRIHGIEGQPSQSLHATFLVSHRMTCGPLRKGRKG